MTNEKVDSRDVEVVEEISTELSTNLAPTAGIFVDSLKRNNKKIRDDRAQAIGEDTAIAYKRAVEDIELSIRKMIREQENMLDLSPTDSHSLTLASDFDSMEFVRLDLELGVKIRNATIKLEVARRQYKQLFEGGE